MIFPSLLHVLPLLSNRTRRTPSSLVDALVACGALKRGAKLPQNSVADIAAAQNRHPHELVAEAASTLELGYAHELTSPTGELVALTGFSPEHLRSLAAIPQVDPHAPYALVVACPAVLDRPAFAQVGVPILLGVAEEIERCWREFSQPGLLEQTLVGLATEASHRGAGELFLGHPAQGRYEFLAHGKRYGGSFDAALFVELRERLLTARVPLSAPHFSKMEVSLTWNGERQVACLRWLPVEQSSPRREESTLYSPALPHIPATPCDRSILLVDDDPWFTTTVANALSLKSWEVTVCHSAGEALKRLESEAPTIIVCDIHMPEMDGVVFVRTLRRRGRESALLVLTSDEDPLREAELILLGIDAFVRKNADPQILLAWCQNLLARENQRRTFQR